MTGASVLRWTCSSAFRIQCELAIEVRIVFVRDLLGRFAPEGRLLVDDLAPEVDREGDVVRMFLDDLFQRQADANSTHLLSVEL